MRDKKANLNMLLPGILALVVGASVMIFGLMMLDDLLVDQSTTQVTVNNETLTSVTETGERVAKATTECGFNAFAVTLIYNATNGNTTNIITSGNYTIDARSGYVYATGGDVWNNTNWNITYTYSRGHNLEVCNPINTTIEGIGAFGDYVGLIVLGVVISIMIGLILLAISGRKVK